MLSEQSEAWHSHAMLEHAKVIWLIRTSFLSNQRHGTHILCWNMQRSFDWSEHAFWAIRGMALTCYVGTCKGHLTDQNILSEQSEALHSHAMLEHAKVIWTIRTCFLSNQRHCTHILCWNMQRSFDWSEHLFWAIRGIPLTCYVGTCKGHLTDQNIFSEQSEAFHSLAMLEHAKVIWLIRTSFLSNQRHSTHSLCWNMQRSFDWSEHPSWAIRGIPLTRYVGTCKGHLTDQNILPEQSEALHSHPMLEHAKVIWLIRTSFLSNQRHSTHLLCWNMQRSFDWSEHPFWAIRGIPLTCYVGTCKGHLTDQNILPEQSEALHSHPMLEHAKVIWLIRTSFLSNQRHSTHILYWKCKGHLTDQNILPEQSEAFHSLAMLEHTKVIWLIRTSFLSNQRHSTHLLCWNIQRSFDWSEHPSWAIRGIPLTNYVGTCKGHLTD